MRKSAGRSIIININLLFTVLILTGGCSDIHFDHSSPIDLPLPKLNTSPHHFMNCEDFFSWSNLKMRQYEAEEKKYLENRAILGPVYDVIWSQSEGTSGQPSSAVPSAGVQTNIQEPGIDEPDMVKSNSTHLFVARTGVVEVLSLPKLIPVQSIEFPEYKDLEIFVAGSQLIVLARQPGLQTSQHSTGRFLVRTFVLKTNTYVEQASHILPGELVSARLADNRLTVVGVFRDRPSGVPEGSFAGVPCDSIQRPLVDDFSFDLTSIHSIHLADPSTLRSTARVGRADLIFMTNKALYVLGKGYEWFSWDPRIHDDPLMQSLIISKYDWRETPAYRSAGAVLGHVRDVWALKEREDILHVATTYTAPDHPTTDSPWRQFVRQNRVWSLQEQSRELIVVGQSEEFGRNEDIRSVRYIDDKVYVVTFERTDPLFVFDLSEPHEPQLLSELKVPGFSAYLHPVGAQRLAGVGYEAIDAGGFARLAGIQVSLFDSSNSAQIGVIEQKQFGGRGSFTDVAMDHHAYYYDPQTNLMGFPVRLMRSESNTEPVLEPSDFGFSGALLFDLAEGLAPVARLTHWEWLPSACRSQQLRGSQWNQASPSKDIRRLTQLGPQIATISPFGVKLHSRAPDFAVTISVRFRNVERECQ